MSRLRSTSAVGSGGNSVLGETARDMADRFRAFTRKMDTWQIVQGDDTQVVSHHYLDVLAVKLGYDALGAEANENVYMYKYLGEVPKAVQPFRITYNTEGNSDIYGAESDAFGYPPDNAAGPFIWTDTNKFHEVNDDIVDVRDHSL
ncbi:hypothetical protein MTO96_034575 [Rhipicephalus appendiculatus]